MRTKTLLAVAVLTAAGLATSMAQNVYSLNVVGYYNRTVPAGGYALLANQLVQTNNTVAALLPNVPNGTKVLKWTGTTFATASYLSALGGWSVPDMTLGPGEGFFVQNASSTDMTITFVGEVNQESNTLNFSANQYSLVGLFTPQAGKISTDFGFPAQNGDKVLLWNSTTGSYSTSQYLSALGGWPAEPTLAVGDGFFVQTAADETWTRQFTVQ
jgi:hypothetical protein